MYAMEMNANTVITNLDDVNVARHRQVDELAAEDLEHPDEHHRKDDEGGYEVEAALEAEESLVGRLEPPVEWRADGLGISRHRHRVFRNVGARPAPTPGSGAFLTSSLHHRFLGGGQNEVQQLLRG